MIWRHQEQTEQPSHETLYWENKAPVRWDTIYFPSAHSQSVMIEELNN